MSRKKWLPLALLGGAAVLLALALLALRLTAPDEETESAPLCPLAPADLDRVEYTKDGQTVTLIKTDGEWQLADDPALPLDQSAVQRMVADMAALTAESTLPDGGAVEEMGFDAPTLAFTLAAGDETFSLTVGAQNTLTSLYYARYGQTVCTLAGSDVSGLVSTPRALYAPQTVTDLAADDLTELTVTNGETTLNFVRDGETWTLIDDPDFALNQDTVQRMANTVCSLTTAWTVTAPGAESDYGLDAPNVTVTARGEGGSVTLRFGSETPDGGSCYLAADTAPDVVYEVITQHREAFAYTKEALAAAEE